MGTLRDKAYEELDYLSQLTEVVIGPQNEVLARIPDRVDVTFDLLNRCKSRSWAYNVQYEVSAYQILVQVVPHADYQYIEDIKDVFVLESSDDVSVDFTNSTMTGTVTLVKTVQQMDEKTVLDIAVSKACNHIGYYSWPTKRLREKLITVMNLIEPNHGTEWIKTQQGRIAYAGEIEIRNMLKDAILENKWRIRDTNIIIKVGEWIQEYLSDETDGNLGIVNLMKLKIMIDKDLPIYSIDEVKNVNNP